MQKHTISALILAAMTVGSVSPALAQEGTGSRSATPSMRPAPSRQEEMKDRREELRNDIQDKREGFREDIKERLSNIRKEHIKGWLKRMQRRLGSLIERQHKVADKIGKKLDRAAAAGKDVTALRAQLAEAKTKIDAAKKSLDDMTAQVESILANNSPRDAFAKIHELQKGVFGKIREAHQALVKVLAAMRGLSVTASPTP